MELSQYLSETLSHATFENLYEKLGISKTRCTLMLKRPWTMTLSEVKSLAEVCKMHPVDLILRFHAGYDKVTTKQMDELKENYGEPVS